MKIEYYILTSDYYVLTSDCKELTDAVRAGIDKLSERKLDYGFIADDLPKKASKYIWDAVTKKLPMRGDSMYNRYVMLPEYGIEAIQYAYFDGELCLNKAVFNDKFPYLGEVLEYAVPGVIDYELRKFDSCKCDSVDKLIGYAAYYNCQDETKSKLQLLKQADISNTNNIDNYPDIEISVGYDPDIDKLVLLRVKSNNAGTAINLEIPSFIDVIAHPSTICALQDGGIIKITKQGQDKSLIVSPYRYDAFIGYLDKEDQWICSKDSQVVDLSEVELRLPQKEDEKERNQYKALQDICSDSKMVRPGKQALLKISEIITNAGLIVDIDKIYRGVKCQEVRDIYINDKSKRSLGVAGMDILKARNSNIQTR